MATLIPLTAVEPALVEQLLDTAFGEDRHARTAYRIREGTDWLEALSFAVLDDWETVRGRFVKVFPHEYRRALTEMAAKAAAKPAAKERAAARRARRELEIDDRARVVARDQPVRLLGEVVMRDAGAMDPAQQLQRADEIGGRSGRRFI